MKLSPLKSEQLLYANPISKCAYRALWKRRNTKQKVQRKIEAERNNVEKNVESQVGKSVTSNLNQIKIQI